MYSRLPLPLLASAGGEGVTWSGRRHNKRYGTTIPLNAFPSSSCPVVATARHLSTPHSAKITSCSFTLRSQPRSATCEPYPYPPRVAKLTVGALKSFSPRPEALVVEVTGDQLYSPIFTAHTSEFGFHLYEASGLMPTPGQSSGPSSSPRCPTPASTTSAPSPPPPGRASPPP